MHLGENKLVSRHSGELLAHGSLTLTDKFPASGSSPYSANSLKIPSIHLLNQLSNADSKTRETHYQRRDGCQSLSSLVSGFADFRNRGRCCCVDFFGDVGVGALLLCLESSADWTGLVLGLMGSTHFSGGGPFVLATRDTGWIGCRVACRMAFDLAGGVRECGCRSAGTVIGLWKSPVWACECLQYVFGLTP
jgi:hypothetical protein